ncbi:MAG: DUF4345 family protein [Pseudomonadota bacterium]
MDLLLRVLIGAIALLFLVMGLGYVFDPASNAADLSLTPIGEHGLNTLRGDLGGLFLGSTVLLVLGLVQRRIEWFLSVAVFMGVIASGRIVGFVVDGNPAELALIAFGFEVGITALLVLASYRQLRATREGH